MDETKKFTIPNQENKEGLRRLEIPEPLEIIEKLQEEIIGQEEAVRELARIYTRIISGIRQDRISVRDVIFLAGPSGVGKTQSVILFTKLLLEKQNELAKRNPQNLKPIKITEREIFSKILILNGGDFQHSHEIAKLIGSPPGYLGHRETQGVFDPQNIDNHRIKFTTKIGSEQACVIILIDEVEKVHESFHKALLQILDKGRITLGDNRITILEDAIIFFTSNIGNKEVEELRRKNIGFIKQPINAPAAFRKEYETIFHPEYRGRINRIILYNQLTPEQIKLIAQKEAQKIITSLREQTNIDFSVLLTQEVIDYLAKKGFNPSEGARGIRKVVEKELLDPLAMLYSQLNNELRGKSLVIDIGEEGIIFFEKPAKTYKAGR
jgi:ATP-dependent Clp protease ATP-binding subunit ClpA